jgi:chemotaxis protein MotB
MSEPSAGLTIWKPVMVFLLISLIGTVWLYEYYDDKLRDELRARTAQLAKAESQLADQSAELAAVRAEGDSVSDEMESLKQSHADEVAQLKKWLEQARDAADNLGRQLEDQKKLQDEALAAAKERHEKEMDTLRLAHTRALKTAQVQAADVQEAAARTEDSCAEIDRNYDAAKETIVRLESKLAGLNDAIAASAAEHRAQVERLQRHINERIELARVTPMDAELVRAAREAGIIDDGEPVVAAGADEPATAGETAAAGTEPETADTEAPITPCEMPGVEEALDKLEAEHKAVLAEHEAALKGQADELNKKHLAEIDALKRTHADEVAELRKALDKARGDLEAASEELAAAQEEAADKLAAAEERLKALNVGTETDQPAADPAEIATLREQLEAAQQAARAAEEALAEHKSRSPDTIDDAKQQLAALTTELEQARTDLADVQEQCDARVEQLTAELAEAKAAVAAAEKTVSDARTETEAAQAALAKARDAAEAELASQSQAAEQAQAAAAAAQAEAEQAAQACADETRDLQQALDAAEAEIVDLKTRIDEAGKAAADTETEADARIEALETEVAKHQRAADQARAEGEKDADAAVAALRDLYSRVSSLGGRYTERGMLLRLADKELSFPPGAATLPAGDLPSLDKIADLLADHPDLRVRVEGHTDSSGADELNLTLSRKRAEAVKAALVERGVAAERITAEGLGSSRPIGDNATAVGRSENRRVEVYVIEPEG